MKLERLNTNKAELWHQQYLDALQYDYGVYLRDAEVLTGEAVYQMVASNPRNSLSEIMRSGSQFYRATNSDGQVIGYAKLGLHLYGDGVAFNSVLKTQVLKLLYRLRVRLGRPVDQYAGLHAFAMTAEATPEEGRIFFYEIVQLAKREHQNAKQLKVVVHVVDDRLSKFLRSVGSFTLSAKTCLVAVGGISLPARLYGVDLKDVSS